MKLEISKLLTMKLDWAPFDESDWDCFAGVNSSNPMICTPEEDCVFILDGEELVVITSDDQQVYTLVKKD